MPEKQGKNYSELSKLLSLMSTSGNKFKEGFKKFDKNSARQLYYTISIEVIQAISRDSINDLEKLIKLIENIKNATDNFHEDFRRGIDGSLVDSNLIILACKYTQVSVLEYVFNDPKILNLLNGDSQSLVKPEDVDGDGHNAFYYAVRSGDCKLVEILVKKWPQKYFQVSTDVFSDLLSRSYEELKMKCIALSDEMKIKIEGFIIDNRFYVDGAKSKNKVSKVSHEDINRRIDLVTENIKALLREYSDGSLDTKFFFIARFTVQNIHILKRQLKSTYIKLPWEEIEFCMNAFLTNQKKSETHHRVICNFFLTKDKLFDYLSKFSDALEVEKSSTNNLTIQELAVLPSIQREKVVALIGKRNPEFIELYNEYRNLRDTHSLEIINEYLNLASSTNPKDRENHLIIVRALQIMGEYFKNTLESPKMSAIISDMLLSSLPQNTRKLIIGLRNSLSHAFSLSQRLQLEGDNDDVFFTNVQQDIKVMNRVVVNMLYQTRYQHIKRTLRNIIDCENSDQVRTVLETLDFDFPWWFSDREQIDDNRQLMEWIEELNSLMPGDEIIGRNLLAEVRKSITEFTSTENRFDYMANMMMIQDIRMSINKNYMNANSLRILKFGAQRILSNIDLKIDVNKKQMIETSCSNIFRVIQMKLTFDGLIRTYGLISKIMYKLGCDPQTMQWIQEFRDKLNDKKTGKSSDNQNHKKINKSQMLTQSYDVKISALQSVLDSVNFVTYKNSKKLQVIVEMLVLDVLSILNDPKVNILVDNYLFMDDYSPLLIGKNLRNHLAHGNDIVEIMPFDPMMATFLNAKKIIAENIMESDRNIGKVTQNSLDKLMTKYEQDLETVGYQEEVFRALEEGDFIKLKETLKNGADVNGKNIRSWTALHFAAKGPNIDVVKFVLSKNVDSKVTNDSGESALHIAAQYGRKSTIKLLVENGYDVNAADNSGLTALHKAAENGHAEIVRILIRNKANTAVKSLQGRAPLHSAVLCNHKNVVEILLQQERHVDFNEASGGFTALHIAAEYGHTELVNHFVKCNANVNAKTHQNVTPLANAAINGHVEVVKILISHGAKVVQDVHGVTALHNAVETNRQEIAEILLQHGADVNFTPMIDKFTPINYAAVKGFVNMLKLLLKYHARVNTSTIDGRTPLHYAALHGQVDIIDILIENKAIVDAKNSSNQTPLYYASSEGRDNAVEFLLMKGASHDIVDSKTLTPLHAAALNGHSKCVDMLLKYSANIGVRERDGKTALHLSSINGHVDTTELLIAKGADINAQDSNGFTPLHTASIYGRGKIVQVLVTAGANINLLDRSNNLALELSILKGHVEIVRYFIDNKLPIDQEKIISRSIFIALSHNSQEIVKMIIKNTPMNVKGDYGGELLCCAARNNQVEIVKLLLKLGVAVKVGDALTLAVTAGYKHVIHALLDHENVNINKKLEESTTLLQLAVILNHKSVAELLIKKGANVNAVASDGTSALHSAASKGAFDMIKLLLDNGADPSMKDMKNRTALELALKNSHDHFKSFRILFEFRKISVNYRFNNDEDWTLLHVAAQEGSLPITEYLIEKGADIHLRNKPGSKPIHIAAREGCECLVGYYLDKGIGMDDRGAAGFTLLHYATVGNRVNVVNYLIDKQFDVNVIDCRFRTPLHWASESGFEQVAKILLNSGAAYDPVDICNKKPSEMAENSTIARVFDCINRLFAAVKQNNIKETKHCVDKQVVINAVNRDFVSVLHYAAWKGYIEIVEILLRSGASPNICDKKGSTPLHFAAKFGHLKIAKLLLTNGAIYNAKTNKDNTPLALATDSEIVKLLELINRSFINVKSGNTRVINDLKNADSLDIVKTVMNAQNVDGKTLIVTAIHEKFRKVNDLKDISPGNCKSSMNAVYKLMGHEKYQEAFDECDCILGRREEYLSSDDPGILEVEFQKAYIIYKQQNYQKALDMLSDIYNKQRDVLGENDRNTLKTNCVMGMALHRLGKNEDALKLFEETYEKQRKIMAADDDDLTLTQIQMGLVLMNLEKHEDALVFYNTALEKRLSTGDVGNVLVIQNNIAMVYRLQGKYLEAMDKYQKVYELRRKVLGPNHSDTLRAMFNKIQVLVQQGKSSDALADFQKLLISQNKALGPNHVDTLMTKLQIGDIYCHQGKVVSAMKVFTSIQQPLALILGFNHPEIIILMAKMESIKKVYQYSCGDILKLCQSNEEIREAVESKKSIEALLSSGVDINSKDNNGLTLLHYAVNNQDKSTVRFLLKNNVDCCSLSSKGNTALHFAVTNNNEGIVSVLLEHAKQVLKNSDLHEFINAKTTSGGMTCLHVAAQKGFENIVEILLRNGAIFNCVNFSGNKTPYDLSNNDNIKRLLKLIDELFIDAKNGNEKLTIKLKRYDVGKNVVILNTRNVQGQTLVNSAISNNHKILARKLLDILKNIN